jgi:drug/metabolite transporter (DMT)-like permease
MNRTTIGIALAACTALISGLAIFLNGYAVKQLADAAVFTTLKNGVAAAALLGVVAVVLARRRTPAQRLDTRSWLGMAVVGIVGGSVPFLLFFSGLALASAPSAAFIHKTLFVWVALLAVPFLGERLGWLQIGALATLFASQLLIAAPSGVTWGVGETMIAAATLLWAAEVVLAKRLLVQVDPLVLGVGRLGIGLVVLVGYLALTARLPLIAELSTTQLAWVLATGVVLAGYVGTWLAALQRAPATVVTSVLVLGAPVTAMLDAFARGSVPAGLPLMGHVLIVVGAVVLVGVAMYRERSAQVETGLDVSGARA